MIQRDTIVARATAMGKAGVGIVRLSGSQALSIAKKMVNPDLEILPRKTHYTPFYTHDMSEKIDQGILIFFQAPHSFTGEDSIEFQTHGNPMILDGLIEACLHWGARMAKPGEFSERAFLNNKIDLTQAEAIADLINVSSRDALKGAMASLSGIFSQKIQSLLKSLIHLRVFVEATIDFPEEEIDALSEQWIVSQIEALKKNTQEVLQAAQQGQILREGMTLVIVGRPNAGKSSVLNALSGEETAIVTEVAGTTRDILRAAIHIEGVPVHVVDTAGLRVTEDIVEKEGVKRAYTAMRQADQLLWVLDGTRPECFESIEAELYPTFPEGVPLILLINKMDESLHDFNINTLTKYLKHPERYKIILISAKTHQGLDELKQHLLKCIGYHPQVEGRFMARRRHLEALDRVLKLLHAGEAQFKHHHALELLAEELRCAQQALSSITGEFRSDDLLGEIFSTFCIGK